MSNKNTNQNHSDDINEIWSLFAEEGSEALDLVEECLLYLENNPSDPQRIPELFRAMHTFKGMAGMMGLSVIETLGHGAEDLIGLMRDEGVAPNREMIDLLLTTLDQARMMLDHATTYRQDAESATVETLLTQLRALFAKHHAAPTEMVLEEPLLTSIIATPIPEPVTPLPPSEPDELAVQQIDPATDPLYVNIFLELAQEQISRINTASNALSKGDELALTELEDALDALKHAAEQMNYERLLDTLDNLAKVTNETDRERRGVLLNEIELRLFEELTVIQETVSPTVKQIPGSLSFAWLFRRWHADRVFSDLAHLDEVVNELEQLLTQPVLDVNGLTNERHLADEATYLLQTIYHSCVFYKLDLAAYLTLALEDLYARIAQAEMTANKALAELTKNVLRQLSETVDSIREGEAPEPVDWASMIEQTEAILYIHTEGQVSQVTKEVLDLLDLPPEFKEVITPENLLEIAQALQAGRHFFTILADINQNETVGLAFFEWSQSGDVQLITNITILQGTNSLFKFLLATDQSETELTNILNQIDPTGQFLSWEACALREEIDFQQVASHNPRQESRRRMQMEQEQGVEPIFDRDVLANFIGSIGKLLAAHSVLKKVTDRIAQSDLIENISRWQRQFNGNQSSIGQEIQKAIEALAEDARVLSQVETEMGVGLDQLYETTLAMRMKSIGDIFKPLQGYATTVAQHYGKNVELEVTGAEIDLDHNTLDILDKPLRGLVQFVVMYSLENPEQRRSVGKPATGRVVMRAIKRNSRLQITIEDDGCGLNEVVVINRAQELGWTQFNAAAPDKLAEWVLIEEFGAIYNDSESDLGAIKAELQNCQGQLTLSPRPKGGLRFELTIPLTMSVLNGMVIRADQVQYVVPIDVIHRIIKPAQSEIIHASADGGQNLLRLGEEVIPIHYLSSAANEGVNPENLMVVIEQGEHSIALPVEELIGEQQVLIQPLQGHIAGIRGISGCALLGDGEIGMILDFNEIELNS
ncbi:MAG: chemotaxis protein CheW [Anaerolineae bacterium]|nr:chemotaxis protein CheW [Anaerolineae bacterium]